MSHHYLQRFTHQVAAFALVFCLLAAVRFDVSADVLLVHAQAGDPIIKIDTSVRGSYGNPIYGEYLGEFVTEEDWGHVNGNVISMVFGPDGNLYVSDDAATVQCYDGTTGNWLKTFIAPSPENGLVINNGMVQERGGGISGIIFGADGNLYASGFDSQGPAIFCFYGPTAPMDRPGKLARILPRDHLNPLANFAFCFANGGDGKAYFTNPLENTVRRIDLSTGETEVLLTFENARSVGSYGIDGGGAV
jgi:outer membrane protein assembly factor BamB